MGNQKHEIRIYVACLASYNSGVLHGRWIDATQGENHIWSLVKSMLAASPEENAEEWAIHGAICKSHLSSGVATPLIQPFGSFLTGACELGNWLVRSLRQRAGSWQPQAGEPRKRKTGMVNIRKSVLMLRYALVPRKWLLRGVWEWAAGTWISQSKGHCSPEYSRHLTRSYLTDVELSNPDKVRKLVTAFGKPAARLAQFLSGCGMSSEANAVSRKARGNHNPADRVLLNLKGC
ncbi:MAG: hypothetical protein COA43_04810 [Robiginitomaculum sp.]|nr:MAG: hypothetical protein COA43_04810 [Robiginitomaculum sp.]